LALEADRSEERSPSLDVRRDGVAVVTLDAARERRNTITPALCAQLIDVIERVEQDPSVAAVVLASAKAGFVEGTDVEALKAIKFATDAERFARDVSRAFGRIAALKKPVVAAVHGAALGGGFELALAAHGIVASDHPRTVFALPEVRFGLIPSGNGLMRIALRAGLQAAIDLGTTGKTVGATRALEARLVDDVCPHAILLDVAARRAKALVGRDGVRAGRAIGLARLLANNPLARAVLFGGARRQTRERTHGHYPAPERVLDVLERFAGRGFDAAAELEAKAFGELVVSETAHRMIEVFFTARELRRDRGLDERAEPKDVESAAVIGGGRIGAGVAAVTIGAGIAVRLKEQDDERAGRALKQVRQLVDESSAAAQESRLHRDRVFARLSIATDHSGLRNADIVIEAVPENVALKHAVLRDLERFVEPTCVIASTTSSIPIAQIAQAAGRPERLLGMHYFHPVSKVELLEIVRADKTEPWAVATATALGKRQGKTVIVVKDAPGFYTTRVLAPLLAEAAILVGEGVPIEAVDDALVDWGIPIGPLALLDDVGLDVGAQVAQVLHAAFAERMTPPAAIARLVSEGRQGRATGRGFYRYDDRGGARASRRVPDPGVYALLGVLPATRLPVEEIQMRCALALVNEAVRCFGEGVVRSARDADIGAILGLGFPRFRGGPLRYVDTIGSAETLRRVQGYADRFGERWRPAPLLVQMAKRGDRFYP
jgi:3-hydroxyacyl-CoA dehydrogenase/enoyl-CoA hydratase/3-hydroxybutyryl-CoA epimerase